jgi:hypothetical protein
MGITVVSCIIIKFEELRLSLLREMGKHDCIVGATMKEFNPLELQERNDFLQQMAAYSLFFKKCIKGHFQKKKKSYSVLPYVQFFARCHDTPCRRAMYRDAIMLSRVPYSNKYGSRLYTNATF